MEQHVVEVRLQRILLARQHAPLTVESVGSLLVDFRSAEPEVGGGGWPDELGSLGLERRKLAAALGAALPGPHAVLPGPVHSLSLEVRLASEWDIAFVPVESLVQAVNQTIFAFIGSIDWLVYPLILYLAFLLPHLLKLILVTLKLKQLWTFLKHRV